MEKPRFTLDELETQLPRMKVGNKFRIYGHKSVWTLQKSGDLFYTLVSDLDRQMNILNEAHTATEMFKMAEFMQKAEI